MTCGSYGAVVLGRDVDIRTIACPTKQKTVPSIPMVVVLMTETRFTQLARPDHTHEGAFGSDYGRVHAVVPGGHFRSNEKVVFVYKFPYDMFGPEAPYIPLAHVVGVPLPVGEYPLWPDEWFATDPPLSTHLADLPYGNPRTVRKMRTHLPSGNIFSTLVETLGPGSSKEYPMVNNTPFNDGDLWDTPSLLNQAKMLSFSLACLRSHGILAFPVWGQHHASMVFFSGGGGSLTPESMVQMLGSDSSLQETFVTAGLGGWIGRLHEFVRLRQAKPIRVLSWNLDSFVTTAYPTRMGAVFGSRYQHELDLLVTVETTVAQYNKLCIDLGPSFHSHHAEKPNPPWGCKHRQGQAVYWRTDLFEWLQKDTVELPHNAVVPVVHLRSKTTGHTLVVAGVHMKSWPCGGQDFQDYRDSQCAALLAHIHDLAGQEDTSLLVTGDWNEPAYALYAQNIPNIAAKCKLADVYLPLPTYHPANTTVIGSNWLVDYALVSENVVVESVVPTGEKHYTFCPHAITDHYPLRFNIRLPAVHTTVPMATPMAIPVALPAAVPTTGILSVGELKYVRVKKRVAEQKLSVMLTSVQSEASRWTLDNGRLVLAPTSPGALAVDVYDFAQMDYAWLWPLNTHSNQNGFTVDNRGQIRFGGVHMFVDGCHIRFSNAYHVKRVRWSRASL
jgi:hypothetical protein